MKAIELLEIFLKRPNHTKVLFEAKGIKHQLEGFETIEKCFQAYSKLNPYTEVKFIIDGAEYDIAGFEIPDKGWLDDYVIIFKNG